MGAEEPLTGKPRIERSFERLAANWFPWDAAALTHVLTGYKEGRYEMGVEFLIEDLKSDLALYTWSLHQAASAGFHGDSPDQILKAAGSKVVMEKLARLRANSTPHSLGLSTDRQMSQLRAALVATSSAEALAPHTGVEAEDGFSVSLLRQVGLLLIAWNYPLAFQRACDQVSPEDSLEVLLEHSLGFSPLMLGHYLAHRWQLGERYHEITEVNCLAVDDEMRNLKNICDVGEALARAETPELYPGAAKDWDYAEQAVSEIAGAHGMRIIQDAVTKVSARYRASVPALFGDGDQVVPGQRLKRFKEALISSSNPHLRGCAAELRKELSIVYSSLEPGVINHQAVRRIMLELLPLAGLSGGCIYVIDPLKEQFRRRLQVGTPGRQLPETLDTSSNTVLCQLLKNALQTAVPIVEYETDGLNGATITCPIGNKQKIGVLYAEAAFISLTEESLLLTHVKALRRALEDALKLS